MVDTWAVFAGRPWPADQDSPEPHLVGVFARLLEVRRAFGHVAFLPLPVRHGRTRWRGSAPFGGAIVQIERLTAHGREPT
jgi:hypothetical protein